MNENTKRKAIIYCGAAFSALLLMYVVFPVVTLAQGKPVKWEIINGAGGEFSIFVPEGYVTVSNERYVLGGSGRSQVVVDKKLTLARQINGVVLVVSLFTGAAKDIQKQLEKGERGEPLKDEKIAGFKVKEFAQRYAKQFRRVQYFQSGLTLYKVEGFAGTGDNRIVRGFFDGIRLVDKGNTVAPNAAPGVTKTTLPGLVEIEMARVDDSQPVPMLEVDRPPIFIRTTVLNIPLEYRRATVKFNVLFSSSGKITKVETLESSNKDAEKFFKNNLGQMIFVPAEKDGKLVSVYMAVNSITGMDSNFEVWDQVRRIF